MTQRKTYYPHQHKKINAREYPGTRQICGNCGDPTGRCEEDGIWSEEINDWICPECADEFEQ